MPRKPIKSLTAGIGERTDKGTLITRAMAEQNVATQEANLIIQEDNAAIIAEALDQAIAKALEAVGIQAENDVAANTPVDTGRLRNSITHALEPDGRAVQVGTNVEYAAAVELGSNGRNAYLVPTVKKYSKEYREYIQDHLKNA